MAAGGSVGIDWQRAPFDVEQFRMGVDAGFEHGLHDSTTTVTADGAISTAKIALAHLGEFPDYCSRLAQVEAAPGAGRLGMRPLPVLGRPVGYERVLVGGGAG